MFTGGRTKDYRYADWLQVDDSRDTDWNPWEHAAFEGKSEVSRNYDQVDMMNDLILRNYQFYKFYNLLISLEMSKYENYLFLKIF